MIESKPQISIKPEYSSTSLHPNSPTPLSLSILEEKIKRQLEYTEYTDDMIIFDNLLGQIAKENDLLLKDLKSILYQNKSKYYETSGYINGKRISLQNLIGTFKKIIKKIFVEIEKTIDYELSYEEKLKILDIIEFNMRIKNEFI